MPLTYKELTSSSFRDVSRGLETGINIWPINSSTDKLSKNITKAINTYNNDSAEHAVFNESL